MLQSTRMSEAAGRQDEIRRLSDRLRVLADASFEFAEAAIDYTQLLQTIVERIATVIGDGCVLRLVSADGERLELAALHDVEPEAVALGKRVLASSSAKISQEPLSKRVMESGEALLLPEVDLELLRKETQPEFWPLLERYGPKSLIVLPLRARGTTLGLIYVARRTGPALDEIDRDFARDLAQRAAVVIDNARLIRISRERARRLERSEHRFATTLRSIGDAVIATDEEGKVTFVNPVAEHLTGWTDAEARGRALEEVFRAVDAETRAPIESPVESALRDRASVSLSSRVLLIARSGREIPIADSGAPIMGEDGRPAGVVLVFRDATESRRKAHRRRILAESSAILLSSLDYEQTLARVAEQAVPEIADWCVVDLVSDRGELERVTIAHSDPAKVELIKEFQRRYPPDAAAESGSAKVVRTGEPELVPEIDWELIRRMVPDPERRRILESLGLKSYLVVPLIARGRILGALTCVTAESGRRYDTADLEFAQDLAHRCAYAVDNARLFRQAQEAVAARDEFFSIASHELRTPLTPLRLQLEMLTSALAHGTVSNGAEKKLEVARRQVDRLARLVESLLDVSRLTTGRLRLETEDSDLVDVVGDVVERHRGEAERAGCRVELHAASAVKGHWDRFRVDQIITNLLSNAIKYSAGKPIDVFVLDVSDNDVAVAVQDRGLGIAQEDAERIFRLFERGVSAKHYGGLGLGLYIARQLARAHGGDISVDSAVGEGTTFTLRLPRRPSVPDAQLGNVPQPGRPILVVDDDADIRESVAELLSDRGYSVQTAADGREALELVRDGSVPRVILLDMMMPVMDGWQFVSELRKLPWLPEIPIVVFSAHGDAAQIAQTLHVAGCIKKPFQLSELLETVNALRTARS